MAQLKTALEKFVLLKPLTSSINHFLLVTVLKRTWKGEPILSERDVVRTAQRENSNPTQVFGISSATLTQK
jgi:hypothetical protein